MMLIPSVVGDHEHIDKVVFDANANRLPTDYRQTTDRLPTEIKHDTDRLLHDLISGFSPKHIGNYCKHSAHAH